MCVCGLSLRLVAYCACRVDRYGCLFSAVESVLAVVINLVNGGKLLRAAPYYVRGKVSLHLQLLCFGKVSLDLLLLCICDVVTACDTCFDSFSYVYSDAGFSINITCI